MQEFEYVSAQTVGEAVSSLAEKGKAARVLAGGTDILVQLRGGRYPDLKRLVDVKDIPDMNELRFSPGEGLTLGSAVPCYRIYQNQAISQAYPGLLDAAAMIGGIQIQGRASLGGNLCNSAPSADGIPPLIILGTTCVIAGPSGTREVPAEDFCTGPGQNVLQDGELLVSLRIPAPQKSSGAHYLRFIPRNEMDIAVVGVGSSVVLDGGGKTVTSARISLASVAPTPLLVREAAAALEGKEITDKTIDDAAEAAMAAARPIADMRGTVKQRRHLVGVMTRRTLKGAIERAREA